MSFVTMELAREIENDRNLEQLTSKIKKIIPEKEFEIKIYLSDEIITIYRDINLEDILRCLMERNIGFNIQKYGENIISLFNKVDCYWQLGKPIHEQSEDTIKELNNLI